jgi:hypothetical protein
MKSLTSTACFKAKTNLSEALGVCDFFILRCSLRSESRPKSICQQTSPGSFDSAP